VKKQFISDITDSNFCKWKNPSPITIGEGSTNKINTTDSDLSSSSADIVTKSLCTLYIFSNHAPIVMLN